MPPPPPPVSQLEGASEVVKFQEAMENTLANEEGPLKDQLTKESVILNADVSSYLSQFPEQVTPFAGCLVEGRRDQHVDHELA